MSPWQNRLRQAARTLLRPAPVYLSGESEPALRAFAAWCAEHAGAFCELGVSARWLHACVLPPEARQLPLAEQRDYAKRQFDHYFASASGAASSWALSLSEHPDIPLACAMERGVLDSLTQTAQRHGVQLRRVLPWWARAVQRALATPVAAASKPASGAGSDEDHALDAPGVDRVVAAVEPGTATLLMTRGGRLQRLLIQPSVEPLDWRARTQHAASGEASSSSTVWSRLELTPKPAPHAEPLDDTPGVAAMLRGQVDAQPLVL